MSCCCQDEKLVLRTQLLFYANTQLCILTFIVYQPPCDTGLSETEYSLATQTRTQLSNVPSASGMALILSGLKHNCGHPCPLQEQQESCFEVGTPSQNWAALWHIVWIWVHSCSLIVWHPWKSAKIKKQVQHHQTKGMAKAQMQILSLKP